MTHKEAVIQFIMQISPKAICDDCLKERLSLSHRQRANQITRRLAAESAVFKIKSVCDFCGSEKLSSCSNKSRLHNKAVGSKIEVLSIKEKFVSKVINPKLGIKSLTEIGFQKVGLWTLNGEDLQLQLINASKLRPALYAFVSNKEILYVGKTSQQLNKRLSHYSRPGPTQSTNIRLNVLLKAALTQRHVIEIYAFGDQEKQKVGSFLLDIPAGLEDDIIRNVKPAWNSRKG